MCVIWCIHMCDMTHPYMWRDVSMWLPFIHMMWTGMCLYIYTQILCFAAFTFSSKSHMWKIRHINGWSWHFAYLYISICIFQHEWATDACIGGSFMCDVYVTWIIWRCTMCTTLQHTATHCNTLQHTATHCNTLYLTATHCNTLQHTVSYCISLYLTATHCNTLQHTATHCISLQHTATHCNTLYLTVSHCISLQHTATHCNTLPHTASHCNTLQHTVSHCNTLQHTASHCNTLQHTATHCNMTYMRHDALGCGPQHRGDGLTHSWITCGWHDTSTKNFKSF